MGNKLELGDSKKNKLKMVNLPRLPNDDLKKPHWRDSMPNKLELVENATVNNLKVELKMVNLPRLPNDDLKMPHWRDSMPNKLELAENAPVNNLNSFMNNSSAVLYRTPMSTPKH